MAAVVLEGALRLTSLGGVDEVEMMVPDPQLGWSYRPSAEGWWHKENKVYVRLNREGFRDREHDKTKPSDTVRIAVLGDSFVAALEVPLEEAFWAVAERDLQQCPRFAGKRVEVLGFGVRGYGTAQQLLMLRTRVWEYSPDIVILSFFAGNDITDNSPALNTRDHGTPFFVLQGDQVVLDDSFRSSVAFRARVAAEGGGWAEFKRRSLGRLRLWRLVGAARENLKQWRKAAIGREPGVSEKVFAPPRNPNWKEAWRLTDALIAQMGKEVHEHRAQFLVVSLSVGIQVHPDPQIRQQYMDRARISDLFYPDRRIKSLGDQYGFPVLNLAPMLQQYSEQNHVLLHGFATKGLGYGHWNEIGHRLGGEAVARAVCSRDSLIPAPLAAVR